MAHSDRLVLLDPAALEAHYLGPLLRSHPCRDISTIAEHAYRPAVLQKTLVEIRGHAKLGRGNGAMWAKGHAGYPGPIDRLAKGNGRADTSAGARRTTWLWFNPAEEWLGPPREAR